MDITKARVAQADKIIGKQGMLHGNKDSDGDKVINILDCQPYNKKEQGFIHRIAARAAEKVGATGTAERIREKGEAVDERRSEVREAKEKEGIQQKEEKLVSRTKLEESTKEEREKQATETAIFKEKARGDSQRAKIKQRFSTAPKKSGGGFLSSFVNQPDKKGVVTSRMKTTTKRVKIKSGKGKGKFRTVKVKTRVPVKQQAQQRTQGMPNIFGGSSSSNPNSNSASTPSLFNTNKGKEKAYKVPKIF